MTRRQDFHMRSIRELREHKPKNEFMVYGLRKHTLIEKWLGISAGIERGTTENRAQQRHE